MAFDYQGFATLGVNLNRQKYGPLDISSVFATQADLNYYLTKGTATEGVSKYWYESADKKVVPYPYAGQLIATAFAGEAVKVWVLSEKEDGTFETKNVGDTSTVESDVSDLSEAIDAINVAIGTEATDDDEATGFYKAFADLQAAIKTNADAIGTKATDNDEATGIYKLIEESVYDDSEVRGLIKNISDDYLTSADQEAIDSAIATAAQTAEDNAVKRVMTGDDTGTISEAYDTIKEIAEWIESGDNAEGLDIIQRLAAIENDYLTESDKYDDSAVKERLDAAEGALDDLTIKSATEEFTVTDGVLAVNKIAQDKIDGLTDALTSHNDRIKAIADDYLTSADKYDDKALTERVDGVEALLDGLTIKSADTAEFTVTDGVLAVNAIAQGKITGLTDALAGKVDAKSSTYKEQTVAHRLLTPEEADKLSKLVLNEDGSVTTGQTVAAGDVQGLATWLTSNKETVDGLFSDAHEVKLASALQGITLNGTTLAIDSESRIVDIPVATATALGIVRGSDANNKVSVAADGTMEVNSISVSKLTQEDGEELILFGGSASSIPSSEE